MQFTLFSQNSCQMFITSKTSKIVNLAIRISHITDVFQGSVIT